MKKKIGQSVMAHLIIAYPVTHQQWLVISNLPTWALLDGQPLHTIGIINLVQMMQQAECQEVVYLSCWACSSTLTTGSNEKLDQIWHEWQCQAITHIQQFPTRCSVFFMCNNYVTERTMMNTCPSHQNSKLLWIIVLEPESTMPKLWC